MAAQQLILYAFRAHDEDGREHHGVRQAESPAGVQAWLTRQGMMPLVIKEASLGQQCLAGYQSVVARYQKVKPEELIIVTRQLATLINAGIPLLSCLKTLAEESGNALVAAALHDIVTYVEQGGSLSDAFARHPRLFSDMYINMLRVGEISGKLDVILHRMADLQEYERETREQIKTATRYPKLAGLSVVFAIVILMTFVVPRFIGIFARTGAALPLPTRMLIGMNTIFHDYWYLLLAAVVGVMFGYRWVYGLPDGRLAVDRFKLRMPVFGKLFQKINFGRFARIFSLLLASGVPVLTIFDVVAGVVDNAVLRREIEKVKLQVEKGKTLAMPMRASGFFPALMIQMVAAGEQAGNLDGMMAKVADYFDLESRYTIKNMTTLIEPFLLLILGGFVLFMALAIFMPWWNMMEVFK
ncbi:MAG: type II secretion system F family protein [Deltaproteobacteria bacterium]|nr:type II secretion system F family protein [Candidatus Anaeroferrophillus wilburensis]MBN2889441.1 type II secretion system F family protein [Deltaproteobacteria bacterium]